MYNPILLRKEQEMTGIFLIIKGKCQLYDDEMILKNEFCSGEIYGLYNFIKYCDHKYGINMLNWLYIDDNPQNAHDKNIIITDFRNFIQKHRIERRSMIDTNLAKHFSEEEALMRSNLTAIGSNDIEYFKISWSVLEEIMLNDFNCFKLIFEYYENQERKISDSDKVVSDAAYYTFNNSDKPLLMYINDGIEAGKIYKCNKKCTGLLNDNKIPNLVDYNIYDLTMQNEDFNNDIDKSYQNRNYPEIVVDNEYILKIKYECYVLKVLNITKYRVKKLKYKYDNEKVSGKFLNLIKNMINVNVLNVEIVKKD